MAHKYTEEELIDFLIAFEKEHGRSDLNYFKTHSRQPSFTVYVLRFGSWANALKRAGLYEEPIVDEFTKEEVRAALDSVIERSGGDISASAYRRFNLNKDLPYKVLMNAFRTWDSVLDYAGYDASTLLKPISLKNPENRDPEPAGWKTWSQTERDHYAFEQLIACSESAGGHLSPSMYRESKRWPRVHYFRIRWGSWDKAILMAQRWLLLKEESNNDL